MSEFFLEIGSEELPSGYVQPALDYMNKELSSFFASSDFIALFNDSCKDWAEALMQKLRITRVIKVLIFLNFN